jgi:hypothetical protein
MYNIINTNPVDKTNCAVYVEKSQTCSTFIGSTVLLVDKQGCFFVTIRARLFLFSLSRS